MRAPVSWLRDLVAIPADQTGRQIAARLIAAGLEVESVDTVGAGAAGPLVVGAVRQIEELTEFKKPIRFCQVDVGEAHGGVRGIVCGASNFSVGDLVIVALPGAVLPGGFEIGARKTYGHISDGMICSERELGLGEDHAGIRVLPAGSAEPGDGVAALLGLGDEVLDIAVTPDRGYALSIRGIAREAALAYGVPFADPGSQLADLPAPSGIREPHGCGSDDLAACDLFTLRTIVGFDPAAPSPLWMQTRLIACGMRPVSLAVDVTNYVMLELGQPLHAFDLDKLSGPVRAARPEPGEQFETLDHVVRTLTPDDLVIRDDRGAIGLAGIMGGLLTEIDETTTSIALEAAHFSATTVARASRRHRLSSEASRRFERGVDRDLAPYASARAVELLLRYGGGRYVGMTAVEAAAERPPIALPSTLPGDVAGLVIARETVVDLLTRIGCDVCGDHDLNVTPPSWRPDLTDPIDLVEEVVRLHGYDLLPSTLPAAPLGRGLTVGQRLRRRVGTVLAARGLVEVLTYPFVGSVELDQLQVPAEDPRRRTPRLANPLSDEQPQLRGTLLPGLVGAARRNLGRGSTDLRLFEIGAVFLGEVAPVAERRLGVQRRPSGSEWAEINRPLPVEPLHLAAVLCGQRERAGWWGNGSVVGWADAIETAQVVADACGVRLTTERGDDPSFHPGRVARLLVAGAPVGAAGELHPRVIEATGLPARSAALWLDLDVVFASAPDRRPAPAVGTQPLAKEDLALVVDLDVPADAVRATVTEGAGELLESARLFDVYTGPQVAEGRKSLAFALRFRAPDRTLDAAETAAARDAAVALAAARHGASLRT